MLTSSPREILPANARASQSWLPSDRDDGLSADEVGPAEKCRRFSADIPYGSVCASCVSCEESFCVGLPNGPDEVLITGATGLLGRECVPPVRKDFEDFYERYIICYHSLIFELKLAAEIANDL